VPSVTSWSKLSRACVPQLTARLGHRLIRYEAIGSELPGYAPDAGLADKARPHSGSTEPRFARETDGRVQTIDGRVTSLLTNSDAIK
jgi:hypothetical protein